MKNMGREETLVAGTPNAKVPSEVGPSSFQMFTDRLVPLKLRQRRAQMTEDAAHFCGTVSPTYSAVLSSCNQVSLKREKMRTYKSTSF